MNGTTTGIAIGCLSFLCLLATRPAVADVAPPTVEDLSTQGKSGSAALADDVVQSPAGAMNETLLPAAPGFLLGTPKGGNGAILIGPRQTGDKGILLPLTYDRSNGQALPPR